MKELHGTGARECVVLARRGSRRRPCPASLLVGVLLFWASEPAVAQVKVVGGQIECSQCEIKIEASVVLGGLETEGLDPDGGVLVLRDGGFLAGPTIGGHQIIQYDHRGRLLRPFGRAGSGPGEYSNSLHLTSYRADTVAVVDNNQLRITLVNPDDPDQGYRVHNVPIRPSLPPFTNWVFFEGHWQTSGLGGRDIGEPLHAISPGGALVRSFGRTDGIYRADRPFLTARALTGGARHLWALHYNSYIIEGFDAFGNRVQTLNVESPWFRSWERYPVDAPFKVAPPSEMLGLWEDHRGLLWIVALVAASDWSPVSTNEARGMDVADIHEFYDTMVEVLDPVAGKVITRQRFPGRFLPTGTPGWLYRVEYAGDGDLSYRVFSLGWNKPS